MLGALNESTLLSPLRGLVCYALQTRGLRPGLAAAAPSGAGFELSESCLVSESSDSLSPLLQNFRAAQRSSLRDRASDSLEAVAGRPVPLRFTPA